ncbi:NAD(P)-binding domain-containing protein [Planomicrobium sp. Y74]|uniref:NAD(P)-binding domain-containing protein n=1 Tax=Planomicrobium sp. Y74 TaxID=2478977 RepID=UPI000EF50AF2|nr:NAD(P)-binding domain-containing protein [Planomicrobium sp. Y74]RLQ92196.1 flavoprotein [Planomicrobium sp. Y74]
MKKDLLPIAIIGGGPVGLAAAAQLSLKRRPFILFEAGPTLGTSFLDYEHVRLFSTWRYNMDSAAKKLLKMHGKKLPDEELLPLAAEIVTDYLKPLGELPEIAPYVHLNSKVIHISRSGLDKMKDHNRENKPFLLIVENDGLYKEYEAGAVIDATGTWQNPNPLVSGGMQQKEYTFHSRLPDILNKDCATFSGKNIAVAGSGHSAFNTILDLLELQKSSPETEITWLVRGKVQQSLFGGGDTDQLAARGELGNRMKESVDAGLLRVEEECFIRQIERDENNRMLLTTSQKDKSKILGPYDEVIANTGSRPDFSFLREIRYQSDPSLESVPALAPLIDPNVHSCGTVRPHGEEELRQPEKDFYIVGAKSYGRAPTFLLATGYEQIRSVVAYLTGDLEASKRVELSLPETGVCSSRPVKLQQLAANSGKACC